MGQKDIDNDRSDELRYSLPNIQIKYATNHTNISLFKKKNVLS